MKKVFAGLVLAGSALAGACSDGTGPVSAPQFSREITFPGFQQTLTQGSARLEIELLPNGLVAREIEIKDPSELTDEEEIESRITAVQSSAAGGTITLALGDLKVDFAPTTRFQTEDGGDLTMAEFVARVEAALAAGRRPAVEAERSAPATPQAPDDPAFVAAELELDDEADEPEIEINVDGDNVAACSDLAVPPTGCLGAVRVLGLGIAIVQGVTELEAEVEDLEGEVEFEALVRAVDVAAGSVTLMDGTVVRIVPGTEFETESGDDDQLRSLADVAAAVAAGLFVEADGKGVVESTAPLTLVAIEIEFEVEDAAEDIPGGMAFQGAVTAVHVTAGSFTLAGGTSVRVTPETGIEPGGDLLTLEAVSQAVVAGRPVRAEGRGVRDASGTVVAIVVKFEVDD